MLAYTNERACFLTRAHHVSIDEENDGAALASRFRRSQAFAATSELGENDANFGFAALVMPKQRQKDHDRQRHTEQPKQNSASHTHGVYLLTNRISQTHSKNVAGIVWFLTRNARLGITSR